MSVKLSCLPQSKHLLSLYDDVSDVGTFDRIIPPVSRSTDLLNDTLYNKCVDKLSGQDERLSSLKGIIAITSNPNLCPFKQLMKEVRATPMYLDRSYMVKIDVTQVP